MNVRSRITARIGAACTSIFSKKFRSRTLSGFKIAIVLVVAGFAPLSHAGTPDGFDVQAWQTWIANVIKTGTAASAPNGIYMTVSKINPSDITKTHRADYFSAVGGYDNQGQFHSGHIEDVSEKWTISADGVRDVDQWLFVVSNLGDVTRTFHQHLVESASGTVISDDAVPMTSEEAAAAWVQQLDFWYAVTTGKGGSTPSTRLR